MEIMTIRELRNHPGQAQETLTQRGEMLLTNNGHPVAVMLAVDSSTLDVTLEALRRIKGQMALRSLREQSSKHGTAQLSMADIDEEIQQARKERQK